MKKNRFKKYITIDGYVIETDKVKFWYNNKPEAEYSLKYWEGL